MEDKHSDGVRLNFVDSSLVTKCPNCRTGLLRRTEDDTFKCYICVREYTVQTLPEEVPTGKRDLTEWEKNQLLDALSEQYLRARGNLNRAKLESSKMIAEHKAEGLKLLMNRVKDEW